MKNAVDYLFAEWHHKPDGLSYGLAGGVRAAEHLKTILLEVKSVPVGGQLALSVFDDDFTYTDPTDPAGPVQVTPRDHQAPAVVAMIEKVLSYTGALARHPPAVIRRGLHGVRRHVAGEPVAGCRSNRMARAMTKTQKNR